MMRREEKRKRDDLIFLRESITVGVVASFVREY